MNTPPASPDHGFSPEFDRWDPLLLDPDKLTPMMQHYVGLKRQYPHCLLLYRLGDFYELFFQDAYIVSRELELVLTGREGGSLGRIPMAGVPHHALDRYAAQLVSKGYALAVCEQMEPADQATGRLVKRDVARIITPGTVLEDEILTARENNYLAAVVLLESGSQGQGSQLDGGLEWGLAYADVSTGEFWICQSQGQERLEQELTRLQPAEVLLPVEVPLGLLRPGQRSQQIPAMLPPQLSYTLRSQEPFRLPEARNEILETYRIRSVDGIGGNGIPLAIRAAGGLLHYLGDTQKGIRLHLQIPRRYQFSDYLILDGSTRRNLELTQTVREGSFVGSLLWALDRTRTAMGGRCLRRWMMQPLLDPIAIRERQETVAEFVAQEFLRTDFQKVLDGVYDLERLAGRAGSGTATARDLVALGQSLSKLDDIAQVLAPASSPLAQGLKQVDPHLAELGQTLQRYLVDSPPLIITEGNLIRSGMDPQVDQLRQQIEADRQWIADLEQSERQRTGIMTLKVGFTKAFGYYISITRAKSTQAPADYIRKQTLTNEERYITPELKEREARIFTAQADLHQLEYELFLELRQSTGQSVEPIRAIAGSLAALDTLAGLAEIAVYRGYCRPQITSDRSLCINVGRHPVVEQSIPAGLFVANDVELGTQSSPDLSSPELPSPDLIVLTGPNMAGKSTFLRQIGLIQVMAQMGSFVPAQSARLGLCDRVFTRVGAVDDLATGQSTFMVEMNETANILNNATPRSLVLLDEIGRGTATFDGLSIAWAVAEYLAHNLGSRTIFATHYHEMNQLAALLPNVSNFQVAVSELADGIVFLHQVKPGGADKSYGIEVGRMAGLPAQVIARAKQVMTQVEAHSRIAVGLRGGKGKREVSPGDRTPPDPQMTLFQGHSLEDELPF